MATHEESLRRVRGGGSRVKTEGGVDAVDPPEGLSRAVCGKGGGGDKPVIGSKSVKIGTIIRAFFEFWDGSMWFEIVPVPCGIKLAYVWWEHTLEGRPTPNGGGQPPAGLGPSYPILWIFQPISEYWPIFRIVRSVRILRKICPKILRNEIPELNTFWYFLFPAAAGAWTRDEF